ncbi:fimbrial protein [Pseudescherichia vulneris]
MNIKHFTHYSVLMLTAAFILLHSGYSLAALPDWQCSGAPVTSLSRSSTLDTDGYGIKPGGTYGPLAISYNGSVPMTCNCPVSGSYTALYSSSSDYPSLADDYLKLNDYLAVHVGFFIQYVGQPAVPFSNLTDRRTFSCTRPGSNVSIPNGGSASASNVTIKLLRGIEGTSTFSGRVASLYVQLNPGGSGTLGALDTSSPVTTVDLNITWTSSASCKFRAGDSFTLDLGRVVKHTLVQGDKPSDGSASKTIDLSVDCQNTDRYTMVNYMFQSVSGSAGNYLLTNIAGLGIGLEDADGNPVGLGVENSVNVPLVSNSASFAIKAYPTKVVSGDPENGNFQAQAIVTVSLP